MTVQDCIQEYKTLGGEVFGNPRHFNQLNYPLIPNFYRTKYDEERLKKVFKGVTDRRKEKLDESDDPNGRTAFESEPELCRTFGFPFPSV